MREYLTLENAILVFFNNTKENQDNPNIIYIIKIFQKYWKTYQDEWPNSYWVVYNKIYEESEEKKIKKINPIDFVEISENEFKKGIEVDNFIKVSDEFYQSDSFLNSDNEKRHDKNKINTTKDQTKSFTNLDEIDKDLDEEFEKSFLKDKKDEKNRGCLDCCIF